MKTNRKVEDLVPGIKLIRTYRSEFFSSDLVAGLSVAAVALPIGIAYASLGGFAPVIGIYSCILPLIAYAIFGSSRQLIVNPDAAACSIVAATVAPLAGSNPDKYLELSIILGTLTGVLCILGGLAGLGVIANFLSRPILTGYLNGIALTIIAGQLGALCGFKVPSAGFFRTVAGTFTRLSQTHLPTLSLGVSLLVLLFLIKKFVPRLPAPLIIAALGCAAVYFIGLSAKGVAVVGTVPSGFPLPLIPKVETHEIWPLLFGSAGIALVSFCSMMTTARGFAAKNGYRIDVNQDMFALGVSDLASAFNRGFVVSGADSRTAVANSAGGKTQVTSLVAAVVISLVLLFLTGPLAYVPIATLAAILISSALGLFDFASLKRYYRISKTEFLHSVVAMLGVMTIGVLPGVLVAVGLALLKLLRQASRPRDAMLGLLPIGDRGEFIPEQNGGVPVPGIIIYRFEASLVFFNADYFSDRVHARLRDSKTTIKHFLLDAEAMPFLDVSGAYEIDSLRAGLAAQGISFGVARVSSLVRMMMDRAGVSESIGADNIHYSIHAGVESVVRMAVRKRSELP